MHLEEALSYPEISATLLVVNELRLGHDYQRAEATARQLMDRQRMLRRTQCSLYADTVLALAELLREQGKHNEAKPFFEEAVQVFRSIGAEITKYGPYQAEEWYQRAMDIARPMLGAQHYLMPVTLSELGRSSADPRQAKEHLQAALALAEEQGVPRYPDQWRYMMDLADANQRLGSWKDARALYGKALAVLNTLPVVTDHDHERIRCLAGSRICSDNLRDWVEVEHQSRLLIPLVRAKFGEDHPWVLRELNWLGASLGMQGRFLEAEMLLRDAYQTFRERLKGFQPLLWITRWFLQMTLREQGKEDDIERSCVVARAAAIARPAEADAMLKGAVGVGGHFSLN